MAITLDQVNDALDHLGTVGHEIIVLANRANSDEGQPLFQEAARRLHSATLALEAARAYLPSVRNAASDYVDQAEAAEYRRLGIV